MRRRKRPSSTPALRSSKRKGRAYETIPKIAEYFAYVTKEIPAPTHATEGGANAVDEFFGKDKNNEFAPVAEYATKFEHAEALRAIAQEVVEERERIKSDTKKQNFVYQQVKKATTILKEAFNGIRDGSSQAGVNEQLAEAQEYIERLREWATPKA